MDDADGSVDATVIPSSSAMGVEPVSAASVKNDDNGSEDKDTCRICRSEGTEDEPLFYPCRCSGSIKYVHQECLMEWLSHTQKKHCELCKTPFRFTKLYHPHMPQTLPTQVFLRRALHHVLAHLVTWSRALLVGSVWLIWLPWCMRFIWRSLFWLGDGGWARDVHTIALTRALRAPPQQTANPLPDAIRSALASNLTVQSLPPLLAPFSQTLNMSDGEPIALTLVKRFFFGYHNEHALRSNSTSALQNATTSTLLTLGHSSILSNVSFLNCLSSSPTLNRAVIDVFEGQLITLFVVVAFILIFLIREWVVQQQPVINIAARAPDQAAVQAELNAVAERADQVLVQGGNNGAGDVHDGPEEPQGPANEQTASDTDNGSQNSSHPPDHQDPTQQSPSSQTTQEDRDKRSQDIYDNMPPRLQQLMNRKETSHATGFIRSMSSSEREELRQEIALWLAEGQRTKPEIYTELYTALGTWAFGPQADNSDDLLNDPFENSEMPRRPNMPARGRSFMAAEIRRSLEESGSAEGSTDGQAGSDLPDELDGERGSEDSNESWQHIPDAASEDVVADARDSPGVGSSKGKGKARADAPEDRSDVSPDPPHEEGSAAPGTGEIPVAAPTSEPLASSEAALTPESASEQPTQTTDNDRPAEAPVRNAPEPPAAPQGWLDRIADWLWGDAAPAQVGDEVGENDEHVVQNLADEAPFVAAQPGEDGQPPANDPEVAAAAAQAGIDVNNPDAVEDAEDLEGILELIGMQGPLTGLFQNAMFSAVLISATVAGAVWFPYLWGKVVLLLVGSPGSLLIKGPLRLVSATADLIVDTCITLGGYLLFWMLWAIGTLLKPLTLVHPVFQLDDWVRTAATPAKSVAESAVYRVAKVFLSVGIAVDQDYLHLSLNSHYALRTIQSAIKDSLASTAAAIACLYRVTSNTSLSELCHEVFPRVSHSVHNLAIYTLQVLGAPFSSILKVDGLKVTINTAPNSSSIDPSLAYWSATDRAIAIFAGYAFFAVMGALYLRRGDTLTSSEQGRKIEGIIADVLKQAGGVLKVILIISIEMIVFPLYCGLLLDIALLPLQEGASIATRIEWTIESPWTSSFVHWFIGTCYMFHFALFVSMCRKIMRSGVLYFIRDPDDPSFHPVRDVLERSVTTQLRKIAFSALVYGALVIICLGGVVWGLSYASDAILPIHWASNKPTVEFPLDLLFYNFLTPLVLRTLKPSDALHTMYEWFFQRCARLLRLSDFLFGDGQPDERGHHVRRTWKAWLLRKEGDVENPVLPGGDAPKDKETYFEEDGRYVRAPSSDQVRIPKGSPVFVEVDRNNARLNSGSEDESIRRYLSTETKRVYIPPWFRVRISAFILAIWFFAAATGLGVTVIPLLFGRKIFTLLLPPDVRMNDIYAFSLGIYTLGGLAYCLMHSRRLLTRLRTAIVYPSSETPTNTTTTTARNLLTTLLAPLARALRILYVYTALTLLLPLALAALLELYLLIPLHAYLAPGEQHTIYLIQDWTLGVLFARIAASLLLWQQPASRPARALRAVVARRGLGDPDAWLATRCFVLPLGVGFAVAAAAPLGVAAAVLAGWEAAQRDPAVGMLVCKFAYPAVAAGVVGVWGGVVVGRAARRWRARIRDEVYLIGERLHNFGERRRGGGAAAAAGAGVGERVGA